MADILLVDDDEAIRVLVNEMLTSAGHGVEEAADGMSALEKFAHRAFDIVIADIFMPGEDGIGTIRAIRDQDPFVGIVAISGGSHAAGYDVLRISVELGADFGLPKPFSNAQLLATVTNADNRRRLRCV
jgi:CheY-like chemotaxis protein